MKLRSIALVLTIAFAIATAHAQSGVYVTFNAQQFTQEGVKAFPQPGSANVDRPWLFGAGYGVYYDVTRLPKFGALHTGPVVIGIDGRGETLRQTEFGQEYNRQDGLFSLRVSPKKQIRGTTPYLQGGFGIGHTKVPFRTNYTNNFIYQFGFGVDRKIHRHIDWRIVEATAGFLGDYPTGWYPSGIGPNQSNYLVTLGTGLVFRIK